MFTGIIAGNYPVTELIQKEGLTTFAVTLPNSLTSGLEIGASVAVNGVCLTVVKIISGQVFFDVMAETLAVTTLKLLALSDDVNIERSLKFGDEVGGHLLSGHVDTTAKIINIEESPNNYLLTIEVPKEFIEYILPKGYVGLHGASLTVINPDQVKATFQVSLIPETLRLTNLKSYPIGSKLNLEIDRQTQAIIQTVKKFLSQN